MPVQIWLQKIYIFSHFFWYIQGGNFTRERALFFFRKDLVCYQGLQCTHSLLYLDMSWRRWLVCFTSAEAVKFPSCEFQQLFSSNASSHCVLIFHVLLQLHSIFLHNNRWSVQTTGNQSFSRPKVKIKDKTRKKLMTTCIKYLNEML